MPWIISSNDGLEMNLTAWTDKVSRYLSHAINITSCDMDEAKVSGPAMNRYERTSLVTI